MVIVCAGPVTHSSGVDVVGKFRMWQQNWTASGVGFSTKIKVYPGLGAAIFETDVPSGTRDTNASLPGTHLLH